MTAEPSWARENAGGPTPDEIAAVLAALVHCGRGPATSGYERWRRTRLAAQATGSPPAGSPRC